MRNYEKALLTGLFGLGLCQPATAATALEGILRINSGTTTTDSTGGSIYMGGSYFTMDAAPVIGEYLGDTSKVLKTGLDGGIALGQYQNFVLDPNVPHPAGWQGDTNGDGIAEGGAGSGYGKTPVAGIGSIVQPFSFFTTQTYIGTNSVGYQSGSAHPTPSAEISECVGNTCKLSLQIEAWEVMWNGNAFEQGPRPVNTGPFTVATGTFNLADNSYTVFWDSQINGGAFNSITGHWYLEGTLTPVPEPASVGMMAAGLLMLGGVWRLKKRRA